VLLRELRCALERGVLGSNVSGAIGPTPPNVPFRMNARFQPQSEPPTFGCGTAEIAALSFLAAMSLDWFASGKDRRGAYAVVPRR
jgi:hypothetical protein